ncbi:putative tRNA nucleotidyltransferase protein [Rosellinia necatrix]|uniref:Putative tRNA nucleotidyltransferase protein n=1 Tax=Rosellinia necatrix TaxID=77044 RepID=A0A1W2TGW7_ROSNE|nr:putative tRNA nucleotidyltransferase protein [Rosellinia necatrix]
MLRPLLNVARGLDAADVLPDVPESLVQAVPDGLSLDHIRTLVTETQDGSDAIAILSAVYAVLKSDRFESRLGDDVDPKPALHEIALQIGQMIEPICSGATYDEEDSTDYTSLSRAGLLGLHILRLLHTLGPRGGQTLPTRTLLSITAFTNRGDPWASGSCAELARSLLADYFRDVSPPQAVKPAPFLPQRLVRDAGADRKPSEETAPGTERAHFITQEILTGFLRPLFAKSRPAAVTASGRAAAFPEPGPRYSQGDGFGGGEDVAATKPWKYAHRHAVTIFEWAVENAESTERNLQTTGFSKAQRNLLDKIFREGIMVGYHHAKGHVRLVDFFCRTLRHLVGGIGILSVKYLKDVIPMISEILVDPFGTKYPPTLLSAMLLLQLVLQTCWPRIPHYCNEIIKIAMLSWLNVEGDNSFPPNKPTKEELKQQMIRTVEMLSAIMVAAKLDIFNRVRPLVTKDPRLHPLFISCEGP